MDKYLQDPYPPQGVDLERPSVARVYDYLLEGHTNWAIDRDLGDHLLATFPQARLIAKANRQFLFRVVRQLMRHGVRQFIDLGAGVPTMDHTHSVADAFAPGAAKVVYVDHEPVAVAHSQILLEQQGDPRRHTALNADIRTPKRLWLQVKDTGLIDFSQPVALLMIALLHIRQPDEHGNDIGEQIAAGYRALLPRGSYLALSHATRDGVPLESNDRMAQAQKLYEASSSQGMLRTRAQIAGLFGDFELLDPGLTWVPDWHPEETGSSIHDVRFKQSNESAIYVGVGRKR